MRAFRIGFAAILLASFAGATPAHADPISTAIVIAVSSAAFAASTAGLIIIAALNMAIAYGLSYAASAIIGGGGRGGASGAQETAIGNSGKLTSSGIEPRSFIVGHGMTAGKLVYVNTWGVVDKTPNAYLTIVIALSDLPCASLEGLVVNGVAATYGSGSPDSEMGYAIPEYALDGKNHLWIKFYDGTQTAADDYLVDRYSGSANFPYSSDRIGTGVAYAIVTALVEPKLFTGFPTFKFVLNGAKFYDPRKDTTAGGSGAHRFDNQSTWEWTQNPKVIEYNILRGITYGGAWFYGLQNLNPTRLPAGSWFAAMNECDNTVSNVAGGLDPQYRCGGEIAVNAPPVDAIEELNKACNGRLAEIGGVYKTHVGAAGASVYSFSDGDLLTTNQQTFDQFPSLSQLINAITASFPDPAQGWEMSPAPGRYSPDLETADGGRQLVADILYNMVPYPEQVQRLQRSALEEARRFRKHTIPLPPSAWPVEPLDFIDWTSERNGYESKLFRVDFGTDTASLDIVLVITETDPADYDWEPESDYIPYVPASNAFELPAPQGMSGFSVAATTIDGDGGRQDAAILLTWGTTDISDVNGVIYEVRLASNAAAVSKGQTDHFTAGSLIISENILSGTNYQVRAKFRPASDRETSFSSWLDVTTGDIRISAIDIADASLTATKFAAGIRPVLVTAALPGTASEGDTAVLTTNGKLYRYFSGAWTAAVPAVDVGPGLTASQIASVNAAAVGAGLTASQIASVAAATITGSITETQISNGAISTPKLAAGAVTSNEIAAGAITAGKIGAGEVTAGKIAAGAVSTAELAAGSVTAAKIGAGEITTSKIAAGAVTANEIATNAITAGKVAADAITAGAIAAGAINASAIIVDDIIVTGKLVANAVTSASVSVGSPTAINVPFGASWVTLTSLTKTLVGSGDVLVSFTDYITWNTNGPRGQYRIVDSNGNIHMTTGYGGGSCPDFITSAGSGLDTTGQSGSVIYYLQATWEAGNMPTSQIPALVVTELKK